MRLERECCGGAQYIDTPTDMSLLMPLQKALSVGGLGLWEKPPMSLSFLAPAALVLSALCVLPILAHMARQKPRVESPFGAMMLLRRVVKRLRRRRRIRD